MHYAWQAGVRRSLGSFSIRLAAFQARGGARMIKYSRHSKRRMKLYNISKADVELVVKNGESEILADGKIAFIFNISHKFKYPIKVVAARDSDSLEVVTAYPLKKGIVKK
jgi:hypothetical protein